MGSLAHLSDGLASVCPIINSEDLVFDTRCLFHAPRHEHPYQKCQYEKQQQQQQQQQLVFVAQRSHACQAKTQGRLTIKLYNAST